MTQILYELSGNLFLRDPQKSAMGRTILEKAIELIDQVGFEHFTFRKLADEAGCTEPTIYRYFENKHQLLLYVADWYWAMIGFQIDFATNNIASPRDKLRIALSLIGGKQASVADYVDHQALHRVIIAEMDKAIWTRSVGNSHHKVLLESYISVLAKLSAIVREINPSYRFPTSLMCTVMQASKYQLYACRHLPALTDFSASDVQRQEIAPALLEFLEGIVLGSLQISPRDDQ